MPRVIMHTWLLQHTPFTPGTFNTRTDRQAGTNTDIKKHKKDKTEENLYADNLRQKPRQ